jgi:hypothetical protein
MKSIAQRFEIRDGVLCKIDASGILVRSHHPIGTRVVQWLPVGERILVREDYDQFPRGVSNVYCLDTEFRRIWSAQLPSEDDVYVQINPGPSCNSWGCFYCTIDPHTGCIIEKEFTK